MNIIRSLLPSLDMELKITARWSLIIEEAYSINMGESLKSNFQRTAINSLVLLLLLLCHLVDFRQLLVGFTCSHDSHTELEES